MPDEPAGLSPEALTEESIKAKEMAAAAQDHSKRNRELILAVLIVVGFGFLALLFTVAGALQNSLANKQATYLDLRDQVHLQNSLLKQLIEKK